jgi:hypothetical protein
MNDSLKDILDKIKDQQSAVARQEKRGDGREEAGELNEYETPEKKETPVSRLTAWKEQFLKWPLWKKTFVGCAMLIFVAAFFSEDKNTMRIGEGKRISPSEAAFQRVLANPSDDDVDLAHLSSSMWPDGKAYEWCGKVCRIRDGGKTKAFLISNISGRAFIGEITSDTSDPSARIGDNVCVTGVNYEHRPPLSAEEKRSLLVSSGCPLLPQNWWVPVLTNDASISDTWFRAWGQFLVKDE